MKGTMGVYDELETKLAKQHSLFSYGFHLSYQGLKDKASELFERAIEINPMY